MKLKELHETQAELYGLLVVGQQTETSEDPLASFDLIESAPSRGGDNPLEICMEGEQKAQLTEAIFNLSEREQLILSLYYYEELTIGEIAEIVGVGYSRIYQIHARALLNLRHQLSHTYRKAGTMTCAAKPT